MPESPSAAQAMLALLADQYGDASGVAEEAIRRLHAAHYQAVTNDVTVTSRTGTERTPAVGSAAHPEQPRRVTVTQPVTPKPGQAARRAALVRRIKELHAGGETASAIAARLKREGEATLTGRGQWRHKAVQALINEAGVS